MLHEVLFSVGGMKSECVGVVKDKEMKVEEIETPLTLGESEEGRVHRGRTPLF